MFKKNFIFFKFLSSAIFFLPQTEPIFLSQSLSKWPFLGGQLSISCYFFYIQNVVEKYFSQNQFVTIVQSDITIVVPWQLSTGSIHDYLFCYCPWWVFYLRYWELCVALGCRVDGWGAGRHVICSPSCLVRYIMTQGRLKPSQTCFQWCLSTTRIYMHTL